MNFTRFFAPKGYLLRDYCFINLYVYNNRTELMKGSFFDKIKFLGLKNLMDYKMKKVLNMLYDEHLFTLVKLKGLLTHQKDNGWDSLLNNVVISVVVKNSKFKIYNSNDQLLNAILAYFASEVVASYDKSDEILTLINKKMELETSMDLMITKACYENSEGQFKRFR